MTKWLCSDPGDWGKACSLSPPLDVLWGTPPPPPRPLHLPLPGEGEGSCSASRVSTEGLPAPRRPGPVLSPRNEQPGVLERTQHVQPPGACSSCRPPQPAPGRPLPGAWVAGPPEAPVTAGCGPASRGPAGRRRPLRAVRGCERCPCPTGCCDLAALLTRSAQDGRGTTARPVGHRQLPRRWRGSA